jgi:hypothetical protein
VSHPLQRLLCTALLCTTPFLASSANAALFDKAKGVLDTLQNKNIRPTQPASGLSSDEIIRGLKEALRLGSEKIIAQVGKADGYLNDSTIHIPLPENLNTVHKTLDKIGLGSLTADLETRINRAAEKAAPEAKQVFWQAISDMSVEDAKQILEGSNTAATDYFRQRMSTPLSQRFTPIIDASLAEVGAVKAYDQVMGQYKSMPFVPDVKADLTSHAVNKALDGLFHYLAIEEAAIRANPAARTTDILKKVFAN